MGDAGNAPAWPREIVHSGDAPMPATAWARVGAVEALMVSWTALLFAMVSAHAGGILLTSTGDCPGPILGTAVLKMGFLKSTG